MRAVRFHEISLATSDIRGSVEFYESLGFTQAPTADTWPHRYGVLTDGRLCVGLHQYAESTPSRSLALTFVLPDLARQVSDLEALGIELTVRRTGEEVFNEIGFADPFGHAVTLIEARTYSPVSRPAEQLSLCGYFSEISLPATDFEAARAFWEPLGFVSVGEATEPYPHLTLTSDHVDLAFHSPSLSRSALLIFRDRDMRARVDRLRQLRFPLAREVPAALSPSANALLRSPEAATFLLLEGDD